MKKNSFKEKNSKEVNYFKTNILDTDASDFQRKHFLFPYQNSGLFKLTTFLVHYSLNFLQIPACSVADKQGSDLFLKYGTGTVLD